MIQQVELFVDELAVSAVGRCRRGLPGARREPQPDRGPCGDAVFDAVRDATVEAVAG